MHSTPLLPLAMLSWKNNQIIKLLLFVGLSKTFFGVLIIMKKALLINALQFARQNLSI
jgi:hypothetical protein